MTERFEPPRIQSKRSPLLLTVAGVLIVAAGLGGIASRVVALARPSGLDPICAALRHESPDGRFVITARVPRRFDLLPTGGCPVFAGRLILSDRLGREHGSFQTSEAVSSYEPDWRFDRVVLSYIYSVPPSIGEIRYSTDDGLLEHTSESRHFELIEAIRDGSLSRVLSAIEKGADVNAMDSRGKIALHVAVSMGRSDILNLLLSHGAKIDRVGATGQTALQIEADSTATEQGRLECLQILADRGLDPAAGPESAGPLLIRRSLAEIEFLLKRGARVDIIDAEGQTPLGINSGIASTDLEKLRLLWKKSQFGTAAWKGNASSVIISLADLGAPGIDFIFEMGVDLNYRLKDSEGNESSILGWAIRSNGVTYDEHPKLVESLLRRGADPNLPLVGAESTPLEMALGLVNYEVLEVLLKYKANPNMKNVEGCTPLDLAKRMKAEHPNAHDPDFEQYALGQCIRLLEEAGGVAACS